MKNLSLCAAVLAATTTLAAPTVAGNNHYIGDINIVGENSCPRGWAATDGQLLSISENTALFSLLGTMYGGDGRTTFGLPDLRSRVPIGIGRGPGLSNVTQGQKGGVESNTMTEAQMPTHTHTATSTATSNLNATDQVADVHTPGGGRLATFANANAKVYASAGTFDQVMEAGSVTTTVTTSLATTGANASVSNIQPFLGVRYCIATQGIYPSRN